MAEGNQSPAFDEEVAAIVRRKAARLAARADFAGVERDDVEQELAVRVLTRLQKFDPRRGSVAAFVQMLANSFAINLIRERHTRKRAPAGSLDARVGDGEGGHPGPRGPRRRARGREPAGS